MKKFNWTKSKYNQLIFSCALMTSILHKRRMHFTELIDNHVDANALGGWDLDH